MGVCCFSHQGGHFRCLKIWKAVTIEELVLEYPKGLKNKGEQSQEDVFFSHKELSDSLNYPRGSESLAPWSTPVVLTQAGGKWRSSEHSLVGRGLA